MKIYNASGPWDLAATSYEGVDDSDSACFVSSDRLVMQSGSIELRLVIDTVNNHGGELTHSIVIKLAKSRLITADT